MNDFYFSEIRWTVDMPMIRNEIYFASGSYNIKAKKSWSNTLQVELINLINLVGLISKRAQDLIKLYLKFFRTSSGNMFSS